MRLGSVTYNNGKAQQLLEVFSLYDFEGPLREIHDKFCELAVKYQVPLKLKAYYIDGSGPSGDTSTIKEVGFERLFLEVHVMQYDDYGSLCLFGERDVLPDEKAALIISKQKLDGIKLIQKREQLARLAKELEELEEGKK